MVYDILNCKLKVQNNYKFSQFYPFFRKKISIYNKEWFWRPHVSTLMLLGEMKRIPNLWHPGKPIFFRIVITLHE